MVSARHARCHCGETAVLVAVMADREQRQAVAVLLCHDCCEGEAWGECAEGVYPLVEPELAEPSEERVRYGEPAGTWHCQGRLRSTGA